MTQYASYWIEIPIIYIKRGMTVFVKLGLIRKLNLLLSYRFDAKGNYKLSNI
jgi:hypothetical protein